MLKLGQLEAETCSRHVYGGEIGGNVFSEILVGGGGEGDKKEEFNVLW